MNTYTIAFSITNQRITVSEHTVPVSDTSQYLRAAFSFDGNWNSLSRVGVFIGVRSGMNRSAGRGAHAVYSVPLDADNSCLFPAEALSSEYRTLLVGAIGYSEDGAARLTTNTCVLRQEPSCFRAHGTPNPPAPDLYADMLRTAHEARALADEIAANAAAGVYDGKDGEDGAQGVPGVTPHINDAGNWCLGTTDTGVRAAGRDGDSGLLPLVPLTLTGGGTCTLQANHMTVVTNTSGTVTLEVGAGVSGMDNEWAVQFTMPAVYSVEFPTVHWTLGIAPVFLAGGTTICRFYYVGTVLCGEWVTV